MIAGMSGSDGSVYKRAKVAVVVVVGRILHGLQSTSCCSASDCFVLACFVKF